MENFFINILLPIGLLLVVITAGIAIIAGIVNSLQNPRGAIKSLAAILLLVVIFVIAYFTADPSNPSAKEVSENVSLLASAGITTVIVFLVGAVLATIFSAVFDMIK